MKELNNKDILGILGSMTNLMNQNKEWLIELDAQNGDGDLGLSMDNGFSKTYESMKDVDEEDLGKYMLLISRKFNETAASTMGTLLSIFFMGVAKDFKGKKKVNLIDLASGLEKGLEAIMGKGGAKPGEKTIIDSLYPAMETLKKAAEENKSLVDAFKEAEEAAHEGMLKTKEMQSVHGRAAYYKKSSIGIQDGGATVGMLMVKGASDYVSKLDN